MFLYAPLIVSYAQVCVSDFMFMVWNCLLMRHMERAVLLPGTSNLARSAFTLVALGHGIQQRERKG